MNLKLRMFGATDKGLVRALNQDAYTCDASRGLVILSDGMGGHAAGEVASHMVVENLADALSAIGQSNPEDLPSRIDECIQKVNTKLILKSQEDSTCRGMGATVNVLCFAHGFVTVGHVGDSRTYLIRAFLSADNKPRFAIWSLTVDHNLGTFLDRGILPLSQQSSNGEYTARDRSKLTRGMGVMADPKPDIYTRRLEIGDVYLTCSDGLHGFVSDKDILRTIVTGALGEAPQRLIELAKAAGAPDNVTVVLSVVSDREEPFRDFSGPVFPSRPFLLRLPNGDIQGPKTSSQAIDMWIRSTLPGETEIAAGLGPWILMRSKEAMIKTYSEFKSDQFISYIYFESSQPIEDDATLENVSGEAILARNKNEKTSKTKIFAFVFFMLAGAVVGWFLTGIDLSSILLPAF